MKIILLVRNPYNRITSHLNHTLLSGKVIDKTEFLKSHNSMNSIYIRRSAYGLILETYVNTFPKENLLLLKFEDLIEGKNLKTVYDFLNINPFTNTQLREVNKTDKRYKQTSLIKFYKNNWMFFNKLPISQGFRKKFREFLDKTFSAKLNSHEKFNLNDVKSLNLESILKEDDLMFKKYSGYSYFELKK